MPHKIDRKRHTRNVRNRRRSLLRRYMELTQNDTVPADQLLASLKDSDQVDLAKRLAQQLAARRVYVRLAQD